MSIRLAVSYAAAGALAIGFVTGDAKAQVNVLRECGSQYQAAKTANELKGQSWQDFLKACRARLAEQSESSEKPTEKPAAATPPAETAPPAAEPAPAPVAAPAPAETKPTPAPAATAPAPAATTPAPAATTTTPAPAPAPAPTATEAKPAPAPAETQPAKPAKDTKAALRARRKKCGAEWRAKKAELLKAHPKLKWPQFWSQCNKRLKAAGE